MLQADGNAVIYNMGTPIYSTGTNFSGANPIPSVQWQVSTDGGMNFTNIDDSANFVNVNGATTPNLNFIAQLTDNGNQYRAVFTNSFGAVTSTPAILNVLEPTAASVSVSGRVLSPTGRGVPNAAIQVTDQNGSTRTARSNPFGYYRFEDIEVGQTLIFNVHSKSYQYDTQVIGISEELTNLNFIPQDSLDKNVQKLEALN